MKIPKIVSQSIIPLRKIIKNLFAYIFSMPVSMKLARQAFSSKPPYFGATTMQTRNGAHFSHREKIRNFALGMFTSASLIVLTGTVFAADKPSAGENPIDVMIPGQNIRSASPFLEDYREDCANGSNAEFMAIPGY